METNQLGIRVIKCFEGIEDGDPNTVNLDPYLCPAGVWTIGWGHAIVHDRRFLTNRNSAGKEIAYAKYPGGITMSEANAFLIKDIRGFEVVVNKILDGVELTSNQFSAIISFTYNVGTRNFATSTLCKMLHQGNFKAAGDQFPRWVYATVQGKKVRLRGLIKRREAERLLFLS